MASMMATGVITAFSIPLFDVMLPSELSRKISVSTHTPALLKDG
jgi:hypothetical protein